MGINRVSWKIGGEAGQGIKTTGEMFARACTRGGLNIFGCSEYPSLIRGGHNNHHILVDKEKVTSTITTTDILVALNKDTIERHQGSVSLGGVIIYDGEKVKLGQGKLRGDIELVNIPLARLVKDNAGGEEIMINNVALGASFALLDYDLGVVIGMVDHTFQKKGREVVKKNEAAIRLGFDYVKRNVKINFLPKLQVIQDKSKKLVITGNEAIALGAIAGGCKFYSAYPMTPASSILHFLSEHQEKYGIIVEQPEDEISAINTAIGAAFAGVRAMTATSGGGFSLMVEALGLAGVTETPLVVIEAQRPGPSTGLPTWTEQGDLRFVLHAAQGEFPRIIIAPGDVKEAFFTAVNAFNLAEKYQTPVIILSDKHLSESHQSEEPFDLTSIKIERGKLLNQSELSKIEKYNRYSIIADGISPRTLPGMEGGIFLANSDEHDEFGYTSEEAEIRKAQMDKRMKKLEKISAEIPEPISYGDKNADLTLVSWGSTKGAVLEALKLLKWKGVKVNFLHFVYLWPFSAKKTIEVLNSARKTLLLENNKTCQLGGLIREQTGIDIKNRLLKYTGRQFFPEEIVGKVREIIS